MTVSAIVWYLLSLPYFITVHVLQYEAIGGWLKVLICFLPNSAISYSLFIIPRLEALGVGLTWSTIFQTTSAYDNLSIGLIFFINIISAVLFYLLALYLENVLPGAYGVTKPAWYLFTKDFWQGKKTYEQFSNDLSASEQPATPALNENFESEPTNRPIGIRIQNLTKKFTSDKTAVNNLSLK